MLRVSIKAALIVVLVVGIAAAGNTLSVTQPPDLREQFAYGDVKGGIEERPSLFGVPAYGRSMRGLLYVPEDNTNGCSPIQDVKKDEKFREPLVFLLQRGNCTFGTKVRYAQDAGATAVIVINTEDQVPTHMSIDGSESSISIPSMIIKRSDGKKLLDYMNPVSKNAVQVSIEYGLTKSEVVTVDLWTSSLDPESAGFNQLGEIFAPLQEQGTLVSNIHYVFVDGTTYHCNLKSQQCGNQCTNKGKYCAVDPDHDLSAGVSGAEVVQENLRRLCLVQVANAQKIFKLPWTYANDFWKNCAEKKNVKEECSRATIEGIHPGLYDSVKKCVDGSGGAEVDSDNENTLIANELKLKDDNNIYLVPSFAFNKAPYFGTTSCRSPLSFNSCPLGQTMCNAFTDEAMPPICRTSAGCELGKTRDACGQCIEPSSSDFINDKNKCFIRNGGVSVGTVIGLIVVFVSILVGAAFLYHQHSAVKMRDELRNIMSQYVPLEGDGGPAPEQTRLI